MSRFAGALALTFILLFPGIAHAQLQVCCAKPALLPDVRATGLEVSQGVQASTLAADGKAYNGVPLVSHRTTVVRLYADVNGNGSANLVSATLTGTRNGKALPGSPLSSDEVFKTLDPGGPKVTAGQRGDSARGFTFTLPDSWTTGVLRLRGRVSAVGVLYGAGGECATAACAVNNTWSVTGVKFLSTGTERVEPVKLVSSSWAAVPKPKVALAYPKLLEPLADGAFQFDPARYASAMDITKLGDAAKIGDLLAHCSSLLGAAVCALALDKNTKASLVLSQLVDATLVSQTCKLIGTPFPCPDQVAGIDNAPTASPAPLGEMSRGKLNSSTLSTAVVSAGAPQGAAHELGHGIERNHASGACGASAKSSPFDPWPPDQRGDLDSIGLDIRPGSGVAYGAEYRAIAPRTLTGVGSSDISQPNWSPDEWFDYMSYCPKHRDGDDFAKLDNWLSARGWRDEFKSLRTYGAAHSRLSATVTPVPGLHVTGFSVDGGPVVIWNARPAVSVVAPDDKKGYSASVRTKDGKIMGTAVLRTEDTHVDDFDSGTATDVKIVDGIVPLVGATALTLPPAAVDVVVTKAGKQVAKRTRSAHKPTVKLTAPTAKARMKTGAALKVAWKAADADKDTLTASVDYSADGGRSFRTVWSGPSTGAATIPGGSLAGAGNGFVRVRVSDGFDTASAVSNVLTVPGRKPDAVITSPAAGATIGASSAIRLAGEAYDDHFAPLTDRNLSWTLDGKPVATGARGALEGVKAGKHTLRLVAVDAVGRKGVAAVKLTVAPVTPQPLTLVAPAKLASTTTSFTLRVAATTASKLTVAGTGVKKQTVSVGRSPKAIMVGVKAGSSAVRLDLTFRAGKYGTRSTLVVAR